MIRLANIHEIPKILHITRSCAKEMMQQNIFQWSEKYPTKELFLQDYQRNELYVKELNNIIIGCIVLTSKIDAPYKTISWLTPNNNNLYVHRLAVHPNFQHQGNAQKLMTFAEDFALKNNYVSIRLDTFSQNKRNQQFYELRGYQKVGKVYYLNQCNDPFYCYERLCNK